jgi:hypothetical protein
VSPLLIEKIRQNHDNRKFKFQLFNRDIYGQLPLLPAFDWLPVCVTFNCCKKIEKREIPVEAHKKEAKSLKVRNLCVGTYQPVTVTALRHNCFTAVLEECQITAAARDQPKQDE